MDLCLAKHRSGRLALLLALACLFPAQRGAATSVPEEERVYLTEAEPDPAPKFVRHQTVSEKYEDGTVRIQRRVALLSDDSLENDGAYAEYYADGQKFVEGSYQQGVPSGPWQYWHPNGQPCKTVQFDNGQPDGQWDVFREDGTLRAQKNYRHGARHGRWLLYFDDGQQVRAEVPYQDNRIHGDRILFHPNGEQQELSQFKQGQRHGQVTAWNEQGQMTAEAQYENGKRVGEIKRYPVK